MTGRVWLVVGAFVALFVVAVIAEAPPPADRTYGVDCSRLTTGDCFAAREDARRQREIVRQLDKDGTLDRLEAAQHDSNSR